MPDYEASLERYYRSILVPGDVCVDVGAHTGRHTVPMAMCVGPHGIVHAFEPLPAINARLRTVVAALPRDAAPVHVHDVALGVEAGVCDFVAVNELPEYSGFRRRIYDSEVTTSVIRVASDRLDNVLRELPRLDYMKVDVEGGEFLVLGGASTLIRRFAPVITFEFGDNSLVHYQHRAGDMYDLLAGWGYRLLDINGVELDRSGFVASSARQELWDYIALPPQRA